MLKYHKTLEGQVYLLHMEKDKDSDLYMESEKRRQKSEDIATNLVLRDYLYYLTLKPILEK